MAAAQVIVRSVRPIMGTIGTSIFIGNFLVGSALDQKVAAPKGDFYNFKYALGKGFLAGITAPLFLGYVGTKWAFMPGSYLLHNETNTKFNKNGLVPYIFPGYLERHREFTKI
ncbi:MAG: hypothetical protein Harvfovirus5_14 [Harvfovirus sp.]|uniref:Uncharacterized protein n=1 Tax=Harvfovirus sp. TaxID=2487768 RepID=A0A3G5A0Q4_9VIRU|nr:MAG: hypothetical protein Harvfovirus5_14 [Harvfovirus sp.]